MSKRRLQRRETRYHSLMAVWVGDAYSLVDMMRYDHCWPATEADSAKFERLVSHRAGMADHIITLVRSSTVSGDRPTFQRWASFNAIVLREWHPEESPPSEDELLALAATTPLLDGAS